MVLNELLLASLFFQQENISKASITFASGERSVVRGKHGRATERDAIRKAGVSQETTTVEDKSSRYKGSAGRHLMRYSGK